MTEPNPGREPLSLAVDAAGLRPGERILDLSGGGGAVAVGAAIAAASSVEALQPDDDHAEEGRRLARSMGSDNVFFHVGRRDRLPFDAGQFDAVLMCGALCREPYPISALREVRRVLTPAGRLVVQETLAFGDAPLDLRVWETERRRDPAHLLFYSREAIASLLDAAGFTAESEVRASVTHDLGQWAGIDGDPGLVAEAKDGFFSLPPHLQDLIDLAVADGTVSFSYSLVTLRAAPR